MTEVVALAMIQGHFDASDASTSPAADPGDDIARASEIYADDAVVEWPQGGERMRGKANIIALQIAVPGAAVDVRAAPDHRLRRPLGQRVHDPLRRPAAA